MTVSNSVTPDIWPAAVPFPGSEDPPGHVEDVNGVPARHHYVEAAGTSWHVVTAGDPDKPPLVFLHGFPESWWAFHAQIADLAADAFCVAVDTLGNGQSDKRLDLDYHYGAVAANIAALIDVCGLDRFALVAHDRGAVISDNLCAVPSMADRIVGYVRMQQSGNQPHSEPRPPHELFASPAGVELFKSGLLIDMAYGALPRPDGQPPLVARPLDDTTLARLRREFSFPGVAEGASASFRGASFDRELAERKARLFAAMTMPVLFLQGSRDPGQQPSEYETVSDEVPDGRLVFVDAGHFFHLEAPAETNAEVRGFLTDIGWIGTQA
ncbi:alpha/beta fold hydrolase [Micromonospora sp. WMMD558]|uniref:alpha/beta fold hydrolase n=1 Tax=unclassified Micromonospora TaxID=2617518 RepID=UPI0018AF6702|nr:alpha/beta hydrolase [Micromonospora sp. WMMC415]